MIKLCISPKRTTNINKSSKDTQQDKSPRQKLNTKLSCRPKKEVKSSLKSHKNDFNSRSGNLIQKTLISPRSVRFATEASESSIKLGDNYSLTKSPKINYTEIMNNSSKESSQKPLKRNDSKVKILKSLKSKLLRTLKRKESISRSLIKAIEAQPKTDKTIKQEKKPKKNTTENKSKNKKKKTGKGKREPNPSFNKNKETLLKKLSDLSDRINGFKIDAFISSKYPVEVVNKSAIKIQSMIRGYLVRKVFTQTLQRLKEKRFQEKGENESKKKHLDDVQKQIYKVQLNNLMKMRESDLQEVSDILKNCNHVDSIKKDLEEIINRRYHVLSQSFGGIDQIDSLENKKAFNEPGKKKNIKVVHKRGLNSDRSHNHQRDSEKTPKKKTHVIDEIQVYTHDYSLEIKDEKIQFPRKNEIILEVFEEKEAEKINFLSEQMKINRHAYIERAVYELQLEVFKIVYEECLDKIGKQIMQDHDSAVGNSRVPVRHFNKFSSSIKALKTDYNILISHFSKIFSFNKAEKLLKKIRKHWSVFNLLYNLDDFLLEKYRCFPIFDENNSLRGDKMKKIYKTFELDVINEAFNICIHKIIPVHWVFEFDSNIELPYIVKKFKILLKNWANIEAGKIPDSKMLNCFGYLNEEILQNTREVNLEKIIMFDMEESDEFWVHLKYHETGLLLCLEDDILIDLVLEIIGIA